MEGVRITSIGHAGLHLDTAAGSILCDPWFAPAYFASWFPFPANDQLDEELMDRVTHPDYLYVSHLHLDHFDPTFRRTSPAVGRSIAQSAPNHCHRYPPSRGCYAPPRPSHRLLSAVP